MGSSFPILRWFGTRRRVGPTLGAILLLLLVGCGGPPAAPRTLDLAALFPAAEVAAERVEIDLGTPAARAFLGAGWSTDERRPSGLDFVWSVGRSATVDLFVVAPRDLPLRMRCRPFSYPGGSDQIVAIRLAGKVVGELRLTPGWHEYGVLIPAVALTPGHNLLELAAAYAVAPADVLASDDDRPLAVAWDWIRAGAGARDEQPAVAADGRLRLPPGSEVAWFVASQQGGHLSAGLEGRPGAPGWVEAWWQVDREPARRLASKPVAARRLELALPGAPGPARLALRAVGGEVVIGGLRLELAGVDSPQEPSGPATPSAATPAQPNLLLYSVDTLRADRLGCYGGAAELSPRLDQLAATATVFREVRSPTSWTKPSLATVLTGLDSLSHGLVVREQRLPAAAMTLAERLAAAGYATGAFVTNAYLTPGQGFDQGFEWFVYDPVDAVAATAAALAWLDERRDQRPFLLWVHTIDPHAPYQPGTRWRQRFAAGVPAGLGRVADIRALGRQPAELRSARAAQYSQLYDAEIAQNDAAFGDLLDGLASRGHAADTVVAFLSDHGEAFLERGVVGHGWDLHEETVRVPLVIRPAAGGAPRRVGTPVRLADVAPTLLTAAGVAATDDLDGRSLWPAVVGTAPAPADRFEVLFLDHQGRRQVAARSQRWKMIAPLEVWGTGPPALYDLVADPEERSDRATELPVTAGWLAFEARRAMTTGPRYRADTSAEMDETTRRDLEALGYVVPEH